MSPNAAEILVNPSSPWTSRFNGFSRQAVNPTTSSRPRTTAPPPMVLSNATAGIADPAANSNPPPTAQAHPSEASPSRQSAYRRASMTLASITWRPPTRTERPIMSCELLMSSQCSRPRNDPSGGVMPK